MALVQLSVVEQRYRTVLVVQAGEPASEVAAQFGVSRQQRQQWLSAVEASDKAKAWDLPDLSLMMLATGCQIGECLAIGWEEVDLDAAMVDVCWRLVRRTGVGLLRLPSTKSGKRGERLVPLPSWAMTMLKRRRLAIASEVPAVFPDSR